MKWIGATPGFSDPFSRPLNPSILVVTAYDLDVDLREIAALENLEAFEFANLLDRYQSFLKLLPQDVQSFRKW